MSISFGGEGQARYPKFSPGTIVHVLASPSQTTPPSAPYTTVTNNIPELLPSTFWQIISLSPSSSDKEPHMYILTPVSAPTITVPEDQLVSASFMPGDIVVRIEDGLVFRVVETQIVETMRLGMAGVKEVWCTLEDEVGRIEKDVKTEVLRKADEKKGEGWWPLEE